MCKIYSEEDGGRKTERKQEGFDQTLFSFTGTQEFFEEDNVAYVSFKWI